MADIKLSLREAPSGFDPLRTMVPAEAPISAEGLRALQGPAAGGQFMGGLRSGIAGMSAGAEAAQALSLERAGKLEESAVKRAAAEETMRLSEPDAPRVRSLRDIHGANDAADFALGAVGQGVASMAPSIAGGLVARAGGKGLAGKVTGYAGAYAPAYVMERDEAILNQYQDPTLAATPVEDRARAASIKGGVNAALESIVPAGLANSFLRKPAGSFLGKVGQNMLTEGATEAAQGYVGHRAEKALDPTREYDMAQGLDEFAAGALTGGATTGVMSAPSHLAQAAADRGIALGKKVLPGGKTAPDAPIAPEVPTEKAPTSYADLAGKVADLGKAAFDRARNGTEGMGDATSVVGEGAAEAAARVRDMAGEGAARAKDIVSDSLDRMTDAVTNASSPVDFLRTVFGRGIHEDAADDLNGRDPSLLKGDTLEETESNIRTDEERRAARAARFAQEIMEDPRIAADVKAKTAAMGTDFADENVQEFMAKTLVGQRGATKIADVVQGLVDTAKDVAGFAADKLSGPAASVGTSLRDKIGNAAENIQDRIIKKNMQSATPAEENAYGKVIFEGLTDEAKASPEMRTRLAEVTNTLMAYAAKTGDITTKDLSTLSRISDAMSLFKDPDAMVEQLVQYAALPRDEESFLSRVRKISSAQRDVDQPNSFLTMSLTPEARKELTSGAIKRVAQLVDQFGMVAAEQPDRADAVVEGLAQAFGSKDAALAVLDFYASQNRPNMKYDANDTLVDAPETFDDGTDTGEFSSGAMNNESSSMSEVDAPKASYAFKSPKTRQPFSKLRSDVKGAKESATAAATLLGSKLGPDASARTVPYSEYLKDTNGDPEAEYQRLSKDFDRRIAIHTAKKGEDRRVQINALKGEKLVMEEAYAKGGAAAALDAVFEVLELGDRSASEFVATDELLAEYGKLLGAKKDPSAVPTAGLSADQIKAAQEKVRRANRLIEQTRVTFTKTDGTKLALSAESMWKVRGTMEGSGKGESSAARAKRLFSEAAASVMAREDIASMLLSGGDNVLLTRSEDLWMKRESVTQAGLDEKRAAMDAADVAFKRIRDGGGAERALGRIEKQLEGTGDPTEAAQFAAQRDFIVAAMESGAGNALASLDAVRRDMRRTLADYVKRLEYKAHVETALAASEGARGKIAEMLSSITKEFEGLISGPVKGAPADERLTADERDEHMDVILDTLQLRADREAERARALKANGGGTPAIQFAKAKQRMYAEARRELQGLRHENAEFEVDADDVKGANGGLRKRMDTSSGVRLAEEDTGRAVGSGTTAPRGKGEASRAKMDRDDARRATGRALRERLRELVADRQAVLRDGVYYVKNAAGAPRLSDAPEGTIYVNMGMLREPGGLKKHMENSATQQRMLRVLGLTAEQFTSVFDNVQNAAAFLRDRERAHIKYNAAKEYPRTANGAIDLKGPGATIIELRSTLDALTDLQRGKLVELGAAEMQVKGGVLQYTAPGKRAVPYAAWVEQNPTAFTALMEGISEVEVELAANDRVVLGNDGPYGAKDQAKSDKATQFIGKGSPGSWTGKYAKRWGARANSGTYTAADTVFISAEGVREGRLSPPFKTIALALKAGATIVTDDVANRRRHHNLGEREVAAFLVENGYTEEGETGVWSPVRATEPAPSDSATTSKDSAMKPRALRGGKKPPMSVKLQTAVEQEMARIRGDKVELAFRKFAKLGSSGRYTLTPSLSGKEAKRLVEIAIEAVNPMGVAWHEAMHDFIAMMTNSKGDRELRERLLRAAEDPRVITDLKKLLAKHPGALAQIETDREERLSYMYQFWAAGELAITRPETRNLFTRIAKFLRGLLGIVSQDAHVEAVLEALHAGELTEPSTVAAVIQDLKVETLRDKFSRVAGPIADTANAMFTGATDRLRDTNIPALREIADEFHQAQGEERGGELPFLQKRAQQVGKRLNQLQAILADTTAEQRLTALQNMQAMKTPKSALEKGLAAYLKEMHEYLTRSGVANSVMNPDGTIDWVPIGWVKNYAPRVWDKEALRLHEQDFIKLVTTHIGRTQAKAVYAALVNGDGSTELTESKHSLGFTPWSAAVLDRTLSFITEKNAADFVKFQSKDLTDVMTTYTQRGVHRAEYAVRFGNDGELLAQKLLLASEQGATAEDLEMANNAVMALEGTLGHDFNPHLKSLMSGVMTYQNIILLPLSLFSNLIDPIGIAMRSNNMKEAWTAFVYGMKGIAGQLVNAGPDAQTEMAKTLGLIDDQNMLDAMGHVYNSMHMSRFMKNVNAKFFRWNGMEMWNQRMRVAAMTAAQRFILTNLDNKRYMDELGISKNDVFKLPDGLIATTKSQFSMSKMDKSEIEAAEKRIQAAIFKWVDGAVLRPNAAHRPIWGSDPKFQLVFHLKQFSFSFQHTILKRAHEEVRHGNTAPLWILASYVPFMFMSDVLKGSLTGTINTGADLLTVASNSIARSGILGTSVFGADALGDVARGELPGTSFLGPAFGHLNTLLEGVTGHAGGDQVVNRSVPLLKYL